MMDPKERDLTWLSQIDSIFKSTHIGGDIENGQALEMKTNLKPLLHRRMRTWWNKATLENYLTKNLIPRGLRIQVFPSFPIEDQLFRTRWEEACGNCSKIMMELLIGLNKKELESMEKEIESIQNKLTDLLPQGNMDLYKKELDTQYSVWEKEIKEFKMKKFQRDLRDFQTKKIYKWHHGFEKPHLRRRSQSVSSTASGTSTSSVQEERRPQQQGRNKGKYYTRSYSKYKRSAQTESSELK